MSYDASVSAGTRCCRRWRRAPRPRVSPTQRKRPDERRRREGRPQEPEPSAGSGASFGGAAQLLPGTSHRTRDHPAGPVEETGDRAVLGREAGQVGARSGRPRRPPGSPPARRSRSAAPRRSAVGPTGPCSRRRWRRGRRRRRSGRRAGPVPSSLAHHPADPDVLARAHRSPRRAPRGPRPVAQTSDPDRDREWGSRRNLRLRRLPWWRRRRPTWGGWTVVSERTYDRVVVAGRRADHRDRVVRGHHDQARRSCGREPADRLQRGRLQGRAGRGHGAARARGLPRAWSRRRSPSTPTTSSQRSAQRRTLSSPWPPTTPCSRRS